MKKGKLEVICGSMFSGKTEELIRRLRRAHIAQLKTQVFKHNLDNRATLVHLHSHNGGKISAMAVDTATAIKEAVLDDVHVVAIDEAQFFSNELATLIHTLLDANKHVIVAGLDLDFRGIPFGCMPLLLAMADEVIKLKAVCLVCGADAHFTQRLIDGIPAKFTDPIIFIGAQEHYQARCRSCFHLEQKPKELWY